jgi:post-segregation antitoxin (ccd killing protein)
VTVKLSISVPDDVAAWLTEQVNVSAAVAEAVRAQMHATRTDEVLRAAGFTVTEAGKRRWRERLREPIPAEALAEGRRMLSGSGAPPARGSAA